MADQWHVKVLKPTRKLLLLVRRSLPQRNARNENLKTKKGDKMKHNKKLSPKQKKIARAAKPKNKITKADFKTLKKVAKGKRNKAVARQRAVRNQEMGKPNQYN